MTQSYEADETREVLSLDEITNLFEEGAKPADTIIPKVRRFPSGLKQRV